MQRSSPVLAPSMNVCASAGTAGASRTRIGALDFPRAGCGRAGAGALSRRRHCRPADAARGACGRSAGAVAEPDMKTAPGQAPSGSGARRARAGVEVSGGRGRGLGTALVALLAGSPCFLGREFMGPAVRMGRTASHARDLAHPGRVHDGKTALRTRPWCFVRGFDHALLPLTTQHQRGRSEDCTAAQLGCVGSTERMDVVLQQSRIRAPARSGGPARPAPAARAGGRRPPAAAAWHPART